MTMLEILEMMPAGRRTRRAPRKNAPSCGMMKRSQTAAIPWSANCRTRWPGWLPGLQIDLALGVS